MVFRYWYSLWIKCNEHLGSGSKILSVWNRTPDLIGAGSIMIIHNFHRCFGSKFTESDLDPGIQASFKSRCMPRPLCDKIWKNLHWLVFPFLRQFGLPGSGSVDLIEYGSDPMTNSNFHTHRTAYTVAKCPRRLDMDYCSYYGLLITVQKVNPCE